MDYGNKSGFGPKFDSNGLSEKEKNAHLFDAPTEQVVGEKQEASKPTTEGKAESHSDFAQKAHHAKNQEKKEKKGKKSRTGYIVLKVFMFIIFGALLVLYGIGRAENVNKLIGSTQLPDQEQQQGGTITDVNLGGDSSSGDIGYSYIDIAKLDKMSAMDLAKWHEKEFGGSNINQNALAEFNNWYAVKIAQDNSFDAEYQTALAYVKANPDVLNPAPEKPETKPDEGKTDATEKPDGEQTTEPDASKTPEETPTGDASTTGGAEDKEENKTQGESADAATSAKKD